MKQFLGMLLAMTLLLSLVACGTENEDSEDVSGLLNGVTSGETGGSDVGYEFNIKEDDHTVIVTIANTIQVFTHNGEVVTGYTTYVDAGDAETAKAVASGMNLNDSYYAGMGMKSVTAKGKYVITEYDEQGFPYKTYAELHDYAEMFNQLTQ